ncbi:DEAD/DEAH box helicase [Streptomyces polyrhachis]|uniref:DEAD/DEAH box helicase n=1 Tax=Streptomyces polyrhachis TaxID=1282885 RepID=A0ABW2GI17_9ACTN
MSFSSPALSSADADAGADELTSVQDAGQVAAVVTDETAAEAPADAAPAAEAPEAPELTFADLGLSEQIVRKLTQNGVTTPFPIQAATIPDALAGKDILGRGRTGSGKTLSFGLPLLTTLAGGHTEKKRPRGVILTPTRELAMQVADALQPYGDVLGLKMKVVCGGTSMGNQIYALERGVDILVATPGRLRDLIDRGACSLDQVQIAILDEADQMADLGFLPEVTELLDQIPAGGQRMLFSATLEKEIDTLVKRYLVNPVSHKVDASQGAVTTMTHHVFVVKPKDKAPVTAAIAARKGRTIIFVRTQLGADRVAEQLRESGVKADALHGGMTQGARTRTLADFKDGYVNCLVATDVAARGIHVDGIDLVLNVDPAGDHKDYLHRSGRTARAGRSGAVVSLALPHQRKTIFRLMEDAGVDASRHLVSGRDFDPEVAEITGARSMTEVQAESVANSAKQAEREVASIAQELERATRRAVELRQEADSLAERVARERGEVAEGSEGAAEAAVATDAVDAPVAAAAVVEAVGAVEAEVTRPAVERRDDRGSSYGRERGSSFERRDDRGGFRRDNERRDDRGSSYGRERGSSFERRDDRGGFRRDGERRDERGNFARRDERGSSFERRDDRGGFRRDNERRDDRGGFARRDDRGSSFERRDDRGGFRRDNERGTGGRSYGQGGQGGHRPAQGGGFARRDNERGGSFERRDDRGGFRRDNERRDDRGGFARRDDRGSSSFGRDDRRTGGDRPYNRDSRPASGGAHRPTQTGGFRRPAQGGDHRSAGSFGGNRRDDKPRWKRNG